MYQKYKAKSFGQQDFEACRNTYLDDINAFYEYGLIMEELEAIIEEIKNILQEAER